MRFDGGWFAVARKMFRLDKQNNEFHGDPCLTLTWIYIMGAANFKDSKNILKRQKVILKRAQLAVSVSEISSFVGFGTKAVRRCLLYLEQTGRIGTIKGQAGTIVTIIKYDEYQSFDENGANEGANEGQTEGKRRANEGQTKGKPRATSEQGNKETKKQRNKETSSTPVPVVTDMFNNQTLELNLEHPTTDPIGGTSVDIDVIAIETANPTKNLIGHYCDRFKDRYGTNPSINGKAAGVAKRIVKDFGIEKSKKLVDAFFLMTDGWFLTKRHDLSVLEQNIQAVTVKMDTGHDVNRVEVHQFERKAANYNAAMQAAQELRMR